MVSNYVKETKNIDSNYINYGRNMTKPKKRKRKETQTRVLGLDNRLASNK